jgi:hypothetical protein
MASKTLSSIVGAALLGLGITFAVPATPAEARVHIFVGAPGFYFGPGYYPGPYYGYDYGYYPRYRYRHHCYVRKVRAYRHGRRYVLRRRICR